MVRLGAEKPFFLNWSSEMLFSVAFLLEPMMGTRITDFTYICSKHPVPYV